MMQEMKGVIAIVEALVEGSATSPLASVLEEH